MNVKIDPEWDAALPYNSIPGPSKYALIRGFSPGGKCLDCNSASMVVILDIFIDSLFMLIN